MKLIDTEELLAKVNKIKYLRKLRAKMLCDECREVEAIPVEWLKQWEEKHKNDPCYCDIVSEEILKDWEGKNG